MTTSLKRFLAALAIVVPAAALVSSPVFAAAKPKPHHVSIHKASHKTHAKKAVAPTAS